MTTEAATKRGLVPAAPIARVIREWGGDLETLSFETGFPMDYFRKLGRYLAFDRADKIVITIDPWLWRTDEELAGIYQGYNLVRLDSRKPTVVA